MIYLYYYIVLELSLGVVQTLPSAFWGRPIQYFGCFWPFSAFQGPPRTTPMFWIIFCDFNRPHSINWSCFILVYGVLTIFLWVYTGIFDHFWNTPASVKTSFLDLSPQNSLVIPKNYLEQLLFYCCYTHFLSFCHKRCFFENIFFTSMPLLKIF